MAGVRWRLAAALLTSPLGLLGCAPTPATRGPDSSVQASGTALSADRAGLHGTLVDPPIPPPAQVLRDTAGRPFSVSAESRRRLTMLFFGYTNCPDVCPSTMADLASARRLLPDDLRSQVTVVFVTEDPTRDTPAALRRWLDRLDPNFVGLRGGNRASTAMLEQLYSPETTRNPNPKDPVDDGGSGRHDDRDSYGVDHSGVVYGFTPQGETVLYTGGTTPAQYAADLTLLLAGSR